MTRADKIRQMSDDELAEFVSELACCSWCPIPKYSFDMDCGGLGKDDCKAELTKWLQEDEP